MRKYWVLVGVLAGALVAGDAMAQHQAPNQQPVRAEEPPATNTGEVTLGSIRLPKPVMADGKPLPAGSYQVRLTSQTAKPAVGTSEPLERWVEFLQGKTVRGREVASIVPQNEVKLVVKDAPPASGSSKVQVLRGNEYVRVWFNRGGNHVLVHLPIATAATP
jgi:hypothetical protein